MPVPRLRAEWPCAWNDGNEAREAQEPSETGRLVAIEPTDAELAFRAPELAAAYNVPHNSAMMANTIAFTAEDVRAHYAAMAATGARQFFLYAGDELVGDADFRGLSEGRGEFAILVLAPTRQGKGLGTRLAILLHALAFDALALERVYVTILPQNIASRRLFEKVGYSSDASSVARSYVDEELDISMSIGRREFAQIHAGVIAEIAVRAIPA
jgi:RimJ/RimL family protein N-acetyltransferase